MASAKDFIVGTPLVNLTKTVNIKNAVVYWYVNFWQFGTFYSSEQYVSKTNKRNKSGKILFTEIVSLFLGTMLPANNLWQGYDIAIWDLKRGQCWSNVAAATPPKLTRPWHNTAVYAGYIKRNKSVFQLLMCCTFFASIAFFTFHIRTYHVIVPEGPRAKFSK